MLNMSYTEDKAIEFVDDLMNFISRVLIAQLNYKRKWFPFLNRTKFINSGFIQKHIAIDSEWKKDC